MSNLKTDAGRRPFLKAKINMAETRSIQELPPRGKAKALPLADGRIRLQGNHALALLRLIEARGSLDIRVSPGEYEVLQRWPLRSLELIVAGDTAQDWAQAAVDLLKAGPPPRSLAGWLALLAVLISLLTYCALQLAFGASSIMLR